MQLDEDDVNYALSVKIHGDYKDKSQVWMKVFKKNVEEAISAMGRAMVYRARMTVPYKTGMLSQTGRVEGRGLEREVVFGNEAVPYAAYQERGMRADGTHVVVNYTTPGTGSRYLRNAAESVLNEGIGKYLK